MEVGAERLKIQLLIMVENFPLPIFGLLLDEKEINCHFQLLLTRFRRQCPMCKAM